MMLTRCPACQTVFRLGEDQLRARRGAVRCGHCFHPFNAPENEVGGESAPPAPAARPTPAAAAPSAPPLAPATPSPRPQAQGFDALDFGMLDDLPAADPEPPAAVVSSPPASPRPAWSPPPAAPLPPPDVIRSTRRPVPPTAAREAFDDDDALPTAEFSQTTLPAAPSASRPPAPEPGGDATTGEETGNEARIPVAEVRPAHVRLEPRNLDERYGRDRSTSSPLLRLLGGMAAGLLCGSLAVQAIYLFRMEIARDLPGLRPLLVAACAEVGCEVPLPHAIDLIAVEASELQSEPGRPGSYLLHVTVNNQADHVQAWPHMELTLTDGGDTPLARRVLTPAQWAGTAADAEAISAHQVVAAHIPFRSSTTTPTGYRVIVFYP